MEPRREDDSVGVSRSQQSSFNSLPADVLAIIARRLLPSPEAVLNLPATAARQADRCWCEHRSQIRIARNALLNIRLVSKPLRRAVTHDEFLWFRLCLGLYPKFTARLTGCTALDDLERMRLQFSRQEFRGFGLGHERWRSSPEGSVLAAQMQQALAAQRDFFTSVEPPVVDRSWFAVLNARVGLPLPCMQCGETFTELRNHPDACCHHSAGSGCVFDWDLDDFVTSPHTCCNQTEGCKQGYHDAEQGILSPDWKQRSYDTAHM
jgi:hypothetical protein